MTRTSFRHTCLANTRAGSFDLSDERMLGFLILLVTAVVSFGAGYGTRDLISRRRRAEYRKYEPYVGRPRRPPAFLIHPQNQPPQNQPPQNVEQLRAGTRR